MKKKIKILFKYLAEKPYYLNTNLPHSSHHEQKM